MHDTKERLVRRAAAVLLVVALASAGLAPVYASAQPAVAPVEPGWPASHQPDNDPRPGGPGYLASVPTGVPRDGMTDAELRRADPAAYARIVRERSVIERELLAKVRSALQKRGITVGQQAGPAAWKRAYAALSTTPWSPYGYLRFTLVPSMSPWARNGYLGTLYFIYGIYSPITDSYKWYTVSWPARSGNNRPSDQSKVGIGPIPEYAWKYGFMYGTWRGFEPDGRDAFYPGKWRLDPWTGGPYGRSYLEVHGGIDDHEFAATSGCIRLRAADIVALKSYYDTKMANKKDPQTAKLYVRY